MRWLALIGFTTIAALAQDAREIVIRSLDLDNANERIARSYTFVQRSETRQVDGNGRLKEKKIVTHDITLLEGSPYQRLIARDDKPLTATEERKEEEKLQKSIRERQKETPRQRAKRLAEWDRQRRKNHDALMEIPDAFNLRIAGEESVDGRGLWVIEATPRPGFRGKSTIARFFPKFKGRLWIGKQDSVWVKVEAEALDNISWGLFVARIQKGARMRFEQTRVNDEVWLPKHVSLSIAARVMLLKSIRAEMDVSFRDYRKFTSEARVVSFEAAK